MVLWKLPYTGPGMREGEFLVVSWVFLFLVMKSIDIQVWIFGSIYSEVIDVLWNDISGREARRNCDRNRHGQLFDANR